MTLENDIKRIYAILEVHDKEFEEINNILKLNALAVNKDAHEFKVYHGQRRAY